MNSKQQTSLVVGLVLIVVMGLFPPYTDTIDGTGGYQFFFRKWMEGKPTEVPQDIRARGTKAVGEWIEEQQRRLRRQLDVWMLLIQWVIVAAVTGVFLLVRSDNYRGVTLHGIRQSLRDAREDDRKPPEEKREPLGRPADKATQSFCYHCGQPMEQGRSHCPACGKEVDWS